MRFYCIVNVENNIRGKIVWVNCSYYLHTNKMLYKMTKPIKQSRLVKFSIAIRKDTLVLIDQKAQQENRSRGAMIDVICEKELKPKTEKP